MLKNRSRLPPLGSLRAFEATARQGSITRAAEELGVTHSAVSHQLKTLEAHTGVSLLERTGNSFTLTPAGIRSMASLQAGFDLIADAIANLETPGVRGDIVLSCPPALTALWLVRNIGPFLQEYPGIRLSLRSSPHWKAVIGSDVDLCIRYGNGIWDNRRTTLLSEVDLFPVCSPSMATGLHSPASLKGLPLLCATEDADWDSWLSSVKLSDLPHKRHYLGNDFAMIEASVNGLGVAMGDSVTCRHYLETGMLVAPFKERKRSGSSFYLIEKGTTAKRNAVIAVRDWIIASLSAINSFSARGSAV